MNLATANSPLLAEPMFEPLKRHIIETTGLAYYLGKEATLAAKVQARLTTLGLADCAGYLTRLQNGQDGEAELNELVANLTIGETFFFRHREQFDALRDTVLPELIRANRPRRRLRIWSAGTSIGAEAYSVAILLHEEFAAELAGWDVSILATDINRRFLASAWDGRFNDWALRSATDEFKDKCFVTEGRDWVIRPPYRRDVLFQYHNLVRHPFPSLTHNLAAFDLIFCRNVMMYFDREVMRRLVTQFRASLVDGGWMLVGPSETDVDLFREFRTVNVPGTTLYQKVPGPVPAFQWSVTTPPPEPPPTGWQPPAPLVINLPLPRPATPETPPAADDLAAARALADQGEWQSALDRCRDLLRNDLLRAESHVFHALLLENMGDLAAAEQSLRKAIYLDRGLALPHYHLGLLRRRQGDKAGAARSFRNAIRVLSALEAAAVIAQADGMTVADLEEIIQSELEMLGGCP